LIITLLRYAGEEAARISEGRLANKVGKQMSVLIDGEDEESGQIIARSSADAPEIDGLVFIDTDLDLQAGEFVNVVIKDSDEYDLYADVVE